MEPSDSAFDVSLRTALQGQVSHHTEIIGLGINRSTNVLVKPLRRLTQFVTQPVQFANDRSNSLQLIEWRGSQGSKLLANPVVQFLPVRPIGAANPPPNTQSDEQQA